MLIFDQLKKNDSHLRLLALVILCGLAILASGLWWVQIVSAREYQANLETQSFRTVRIPAVRGKILDRNGTTLAENTPTYNISLYLEEWKDQFRKEYAKIRPRQVVTNSPSALKLWLGPSTVETQYVRIKSAQKIHELEWEARFRVVGNAVQQVSQNLQRPLAFKANEFKTHYLKRLALPYPVVQRISDKDIARFQEQTAATPGMDLEIESTRYYPHTNLAAHLIGHLHLSDRLDEGELSVFDYRLPDFRGLVGIEYAFDAQLHGRAGAKSVLVNNLGYRQTENIWSPAEPGRNVILTIDHRIQDAAERSLQSAAAPRPVRGAVVVMDVNTGDILAMASAPAFDPNFFVNRHAFPPDYYSRIQSVKAEMNRATYENYRPGSIFKPVIALACLEDGLDPNEIYNVQPHSRIAGRGGIFVGRREIRDLARPGPYNFRRALIHSSNSYFIHHGLHTGMDKIAEIARRLHLGERVNLGTRQETSGTFPDQKRLSRGWTDGDTANICIGQGYVDVTPLQMTVLAAALANGGKVLSPRLVDRVEPATFEDGERPVLYPKRQVRNDLGVRASTLRILGEAMLDDTEDPEGTAYTEFRNWPNQKLMRVCGKTGTAQIQNERNQLIGVTTWFLSFAPYENPRYAVVVMVEDGSSGGGTCAPVARKIYDALVEREQAGASRGNTLARGN
jgi:penicillin-binding protein 2